ncbi:MAG: hypothetical protein AABY64_07175 [Bdellovibrionota bacterium]
MKIMVQLIVMQILGVLLLYSLANAAPTTLVTSILSSEVVQQLESQFPKNVHVSLTRVEQVRSYICANCYDFKLTYSGVSSSKRPIKFDKLVRAKGLGPTVEVSLIHP